MKHLITVLLVFAAATFSNQVFGQISVFESAMGSTPDNSNLIMGGTARLTAASGIDPAGSGYLRLTDAVPGQSGYAYINQAFPATTGFVAEFEFACWNDTALGATGLSVFLFDGTVTPANFALGLGGGGLGYVAANMTWSSAGLSGGYVGVGLDEWGGFSAQYYSGDNGLKTTVPQSISIRGRTADHTPYLTGKALSATPLAGNKLSYQSVNKTTRPSENVYYRKARVSILYNSSLGKYQITVALQVNKNGQMIYTGIGPYTLSSPPPSTLKIGFAGATGSFGGVHEIRNIMISSPAQIRVVKTGNATVAQNGAMTYTVNVYNDDMTDITGVNFSDIIPANFLPSGNPVFTPVTTSNALISGSYSGGVYNGTLALKANSYSTFTFNGVAGFAGNTDDSIVNTALAKAPTGYIDSDDANDTSSVITYRIPVATPNSSTICGNSAPAGMPVSDVAGTQYTWTASLTSGTVTGMTDNNMPASAITQTLTNTTTTPGIVTYTMTPVKSYLTRSGMQQITGTPVTYTTTVNPAPVVNATINVIAAAPDVTLSASADGFISSFQWQKNSVDIAGATNNSYTMLNYKKAVDDGVYTIIANNTYNCPATAQINLLAPLPLKLISFSGYRSNHTDRLTWSTSDEKNLNHFEIEYSNDGNQFVAAGMVYATTGISLIHNYAFEYNTNGTAYYRLKMVDNDGKYAYSNVVKLNGQTANTATAAAIAISDVHPIPFGSMLSIEINSSTESRGTISLIDISGKALMTVPVIFTQGASVYTIDNLQQIAAGTYILYIATADGHTAAQKVVK